VNDDESVAAIRRGLELGVTFFDTADVYGTGHSEKVLGRARRRPRRRHDRHEARQRLRGGDAAHDRLDVSPGYIRRACEGSLRRLGTDRIDLYQCHVGDLDRAMADDVAAALEDLCDAGLIRAYGWSTDDPERAGWWAERETLRLLAAPSQRARGRARDVGAVRARRAHQHQPRTVGDGLSSGW
jgi:aryl-alcohol dehydrogenase-like predicted oxidoreductase